MACALIRSGRLREEAVEHAFIDVCQCFQVGAQFHGAEPDGNAVAVTVASINGDEIAIDGNHALAGQTLHFSVKVVEVRAATEDEMSHGHIHGPGCSH